MGNYLGIESLFNTSDVDKNSIATALVELFHSTFDFNISSCDEESYNAVIQTKITTFDSNAILTAYQNELDTYLSSADAVIDGSVKRYEKSMQLLLSKIKSNTATVQTAAVFHLTNDGDFLETPGQQCCNRKCHFRNAQQYSGIRRSKRYR